MKNQRVVILGGSFGIGLAVAQQASSQGAGVVIVSSNAQRVNEAVRSLGAHASGRSFDLSDEKAIEGFFGALGAFDHLVYTAGDALRLGELHATDLREGRNAFELRVWGALAAVKYGGPNIKPGGSIVLTSGIAGDRPRKGWVLGAGVCGAMFSLTKALAMELAPIRVNAVSPGIVKTNLWGNMEAGVRESMYENVAKSLPVGRVGEAADIAKAYLYLMQEGFSTGQIITVDGGAVLV